MERWVGRVALVTGASSGIGAATCRALVKHGMTVVGCARDADRITNLSEELKAQNCQGSLHAIRCDLREENDILDMFKVIRSKFARLDVCVNNAGLAKNASILNGTTADWKNMIDVNILGVNICTREAYKLMNECNCGDGQFININSMSGHRIPPGNSNNYYSASKIMLTALTESLRRELRAIKSKIRVVQICPGIVVTEFAERQNGKEMANALLSKGEFLTADDISSVVVDILKTPPRVDINDVMMRAVDQEM